MNSVLPAAIELYLKEANFSTTEMMILKKLLEQDALTLRELASKSGKSTGVLDIAMKKLLRKGIAKRTVINGTMRYCIDSLDSVGAWVKHDMEERQQDMRRKHQSFEYFIASLKVDKKRPDMEHFTGVEGIQQAYMKLLESGKEMLTLTPVHYRAEDDPLREFKVDYFKKRQVRKIFQRIITADQPLSRRFQSRDAFEYRRTTLLPAEDFSIGFERTIVGDTVACINVQEETACFLQYPELAEAERTTFENLWSHAIAREKGDRQPLSSPLPKTTSTIPLATRFFSQLRQFILSQKSALSLAIFGIVVVTVSLGLSKQSESISLSRLQDHLKSVASVGALHFQVEDIRDVLREENVETPAYARIVSTLNLIRRTDPTIRYAYVMRKTNDPTKLAFVADADSLRPKEERDLDGNGSIGPEDQLSYPGDLYDISEQMYMLDGFEHPIADPAPVTDQWGEFVSGVAPIRDENSETIAMVGIHMSSDKLQELAPSLSSIFFVLGLLFLCISVIRFCLSNKSLMLDVWIAFKKHLRLSVLWIVFISVAIVGLVMLFQWHIQQLKIEETGKRLMAIAATAAGQFDPADLDQLRWAKDMKTEVYQRVFRQLNEIRNKNPEITFAYIFRSTDEKNIFAFVADADSNWQYLPYSKHTIGEFEFDPDEDENVYPGMHYQGLNTDYIYTGALKEPVYGALKDQWGSFITGAAPIFGGKTKYLLGLDIDKDNDL